MNKRSSEIDGALADLGTQNVTVGEARIQQGLGVIIPVDKYVPRSVEKLSLKRRRRLNLEGIKDYARKVENKRKK